MKHELKKQTLIYKELGFPIRLINAPMRKIYGKWVFNFSMGKFQNLIFHMLAVKSSLLTGAEIRFIIDYLQLSYREFAKLLGVSHAAVVKWEKEISRMNPNTEVALRLFILNYLQVSDKEFRQSYLSIQEILSHCREENQPLEIDIEEIAC